MCSPSCVCCSNVVATDQMLKLSGFGFPPIEKSFNDDVMINDVEWIV